MKVLGRGVSCRIQRDSLIEVEDTTIKEGEISKQHTDADIAYLNPFIVSLNEFTVYEFSDIITILNKIEINRVRTKSITLTATKVLFLPSSRLRGFEGLSPAA